MRPEDVYVYTTPDVPGWKFEAACCNNLCYLFNLYDYRGNNNKEAAIGQYIGKACEEAKAIAARQDFNCIVDFKPQITLNGEGYCIVNVNFTIGTLYLN